MISLFVSALDRVAFISKVLLLVVSKNAKKKRRSEGLRVIPAYSAF
jgi:hypothetical protein